MTYHSETLKTLPWGNEYMGQIQKWFLFNVLQELIVI